MRAWCLHRSSCACDLISRGLQTGCMLEASTRQRRGKEAFSGVRGSGLSLCVVVWCGGVPHGNGDILQSAPKEPLCVISGIHEVTSAEAQLPCILVRSSFCYAPPSPALLCGSHSL